MVSIPTEIMGSFSGLGSQIMFWVGWSLMGIVVIAGMFAVFTYFQYNIKADMWRLYGSGKDNVFSFGKKGKQRFKWIKNRTAWKPLFPLFPLFNKKEIEPFDSEFIYPGNQVYTFKLNEDYIPGRVNIDKNEDTIRAEINPVPYYVRNWQSLQHKKNAREFAEHNFWEDNKYFFMVIGTAFLCLIMVGITVYFTYQFATSGAGSMNTLAEAIRNFNTIPGR